MDNVGWGASLFYLPQMGTGVLMSEDTDANQPSNPEEVTKAIKSFQQRS